MGRSTVDEMFVRVILVFTYFFIIFIASRLVDVSVSFVEVTSLSLMCEILPKSLRYCGVCKDEDQELSQTGESKERSLKEAVNLDESLLNEDAAFSLGSKLDDKSIDFVSYDHFLENVEDTKASAWVVWVRPSRSHNKHEQQQVRADQCSKNETILNPKDWDSLSNKLLQYGIRTGTYRCARDTQLCKKHGIKTCSILLSMPAGMKPKGKVATFLHRNRSNCNLNGGEAKGKICLLEWIKSKLKSKVLVLSKKDELSAMLKRSKQQHKTAPKSNLNIIYESANKMPPLLISALSVKFVGRIKFVQMKSHKRTDSLYPFELSSMYAVTSSSNYTYGFRKGEKFHFSNLDMFLRTLYPEANDMFLLILMLVNMASLFELFVQKGGPLRRLISFSWIAFISNCLFIFTWLPLIRVLQIPEIGPVVEFFLKSLQSVMFSEVAAMIRKDILLLSQHFGIFGLGLVLYGSVIGYLRFVISNRGLPRPTLSSVWNEDLNEIREFFESLLTLATPPLFYFELEERLESFLQRLSMPDLWLHPLNSSQYVRHLICWKFCKRHFELSSQQVSNSAPISNKRNSGKCTCQQRGVKLPEYAIQCIDCIVCLEHYKCGEIVKLLPCGHCFHRGCIDCWLLQSFDPKNKKCPVCRWPANKQKHFVNQEDLEN